MRRLPTLALATALAGCSAGSAVEQSAAVSPRCEVTLDAIGYQCEDGSRFSVRYAPEADCAVVFAGFQTFVLAATSDETYSNGAVTLRTREHGTMTSLSGAAGPYEQCSWLLD